MKNLSSTLFQVFEVMYIHMHSTVIERKLNDKIKVNTQWPIYIQCNPL
jgi:hypothetical protein